MISRTSGVRRIFLILFFLSLTIFFTGCSKKVILISGRTDISGHKKSTSSLAFSVVRSARSQIGKPYHWGGCSPYEGFDCSGLVWWVYNDNGINIPRVSWQQLKTGRAVHKSRMQAGDIVFFRIPGQGKSLHTGIYSGNGNSFIHSPKSGHTVREESMNKKYWQKYFIAARRVL